jgi:hypothetical protein
MEKNCLPILEKYHELRDEFVTMLQKMKMVTQPLATCIIQPILCGMIQSLTSHVIHDTPRGFKVTMEWTY